MGVPQYLDGLFHGKTYQKMYYYVGNPHFRKPPNDSKLTIQKLRNQLSNISKSSISKKISKLIINMIFTTFTSGIGDNYPIFRHTHMFNDTALKTAISRRYWSTVHFADSVDPSYG